MNESKKRGKKTSLEQMTIIVDYLEVNRILITGKTNPNSVEVLEKLWDDLVTILNEVANGSKKDKKQWKNFLTEWKSKTRKKARIAKRDQTMTGGGPSDGENLSDIENRLMKVIGWITITGCDDLPPEINPDSDQNNMTLDLDNGLREVAMEIVNGNDISFNEEYLIELEALPVGEIQEPASSIQEEPKQNLKSRKTTKNSRQISQLEKSAELYSKSAEVMAEAIKQMALSITKLAEALSVMAIAIANKNTGIFQDKD